MVDSTDPSVLFSKQANLHSGLRYNCYSTDLFFVIAAKKPARTNGSHWFSFDFGRPLSQAEEFGLPNTAKIARFCTGLERKLAKAPQKNLVFYSASEPTHRMKSAFLLGAYLILKKDASPEYVHTLFKDIETRGLVAGFEGLNAWECSGPLYLGECFQAIHRAKSLGFLDLATFDLPAYEHFERAENGDMNWIIPAAFLKYFKQHNVEAVVRLNCAEYDRETFVTNGVAHHELFFDDCSLPPLHLVDRFLEIVDNTTGAIAVHCRAGIGRTGTLTCCHLIKNFGFTARESIAYARIQRPGSVIGSQQDFLEQFASRLVLHLKIGDLLHTCLGLPTIGDGHGLEQARQAAVSVAGDLGTPQVAYSDNTSIPVAVKAAPKPTMAAMIQRKQPTFPQAIALAATQPAADGTAGTVRRSVRLSAYVK